MEKNERIKAIDYARAFAMILVMCSHSVPNGSVVKTFVSAMDLPLFFTVSGMVLRYADEYRAKNFLERIKTLFERLLIPYFLWGLIYCKFTLKAPLYLAYGSHLALKKAETVTALWFIPVIFLAEIWCEFVMWIASKKDSRQKAAIELFAAVVFWLVGFIMPKVGGLGYPWGVNVSFVASGYMLFGHTAILFLLKNVNKIHWMISMLCAAFGTGFYFFVFEKNPTEVGFSLTARGIFGSPVRYLFISYVGIVTVMFIATVVDRGKLLKRPLYNIGRNTFGIFVLHKPFTTAIAQIAADKGQSDNPLFIVLAVMVGLIVSFVGIAFLERFIPELLGKRRERQNAGFSKTS
jgi:hypothetical protein